MSPKKFDTRLIETIPRSGDVATFRFEKPAGYDYQAGQWAAIDITHGDETLSHHFTHASSPTEPHLDITTHVRPSDFKQALSALRPGDEVQMEGPYGSFVLREGSPQVAFLTGGIGITTVRSILRFLADGGGATGGSEDRGLVLLYGNRDLASAVYREELDLLDDELPSLEVHHVLEEPPAGWRGHTGLITKEIVEHTVRDPAGCTFYVSGPPKMVAAMRGVLGELSIPRDAIVAEDFTGYE